MLKKKKKASFPQKKRVWPYILLGLLVIGLVTPKSNNSSKSLSEENSSSSQKIASVNKEQSTESEKTATISSETSESTASSTKVDASEEKPSQIVYPKKANSHGMNRGWIDGDVPYKDGVPNYVGMTGYIGADTPYSITNVENLNGNWTVPTYVKDKNAYVESGSLPDKTKFKVIDQDIHHDHHSIYEGYLTVQIDGTDESRIIDLHDFVEDYVPDLSIFEAACVKPYIATYHQRSDEYPVIYNTNDREAVTDIPDGASVIVDGILIDTDKDHVKGYIFKEWKLGFGGVVCLINTEDLDFVY